MATRQQAAREFVKTWSTAKKGREDADRQTFWNDLLQRVFGVDNYYDYIDYEKDVQVKANDKITTRRIDGYIPSTKVMIEMKGKKVHDLSKPLEQSGGDILTPFEQAKRYANFLPNSEQPRWILVSNFNEIDIHDMEKPLSSPKVIQLENLAHQFKDLEFLVNSSRQKIIDEKKLSVDAGNLVGEIYSELTTAYSQGRGIDINDPRIQRSLNMLIVRIVFLLYADDSNLFGEADLFQNFIGRRTPRDIRQDLLILFRVLDEPEKQRDPYLDDEFNSFAYVNGGMFSDENIIIPQFTEKLKKLIFEKAGQGFDWSGISPTIFGAVFESTLNPTTRRTGGMHYTSIENIHKVIDPLFLSNLHEEFDQIQNMGNRRQRVLQAKEFRQKLGKLKFFDPACGSGNFLTETYLSLRKMENECLRIIYGNQNTLLIADEPVKVKIQNFYGIEINDFAVSVARTAMWIAESQMWEQTKEITFADLDFLPLDSNDSIYEGDALKIDWASISKAYELDYIMGNPPFVGHQWRSDSQKNDMELAFFDLKKHGKLDYVTAWYAKAAQYAKNTTIKIAFVSTNSICQGEPVSILWKYLTEKYNVEIQFAYRTFVWTNEAKDAAKVHCVITGFSTVHVEDAKYIFDSNGEITKTNHINGYLLSAPDVYVKSRGQGIYNDYKIGKGSQATDGGNLILSPDETEKFIVNYPAAKDLVRPFIGSREFLNNEQRFCLWLINIKPDRYANNHFIIDRLEKIRKIRLKSKTASVVEAANMPYAFTQNRQPETDYLVIPRTSSGKREYLPIGYESKDVIASDAVIILPNANHFIFGLLNSSVHNAWMKCVCGRLKSDYRYSNAIFTNFPRPVFDEHIQNKIAQTAEAILDARALFPNSSLATLYAPLTMPVELRKAHKANDRAVLAAYGLKGSSTDTDIAQHLFKMYEKLIRK